MKLSLQVEARDDRQRLDAFVARAWPERTGEPAPTRGAVQRWIEAGRVLVDGAKTKASHRLTTGARVEVDPPPPPATEAAPDASVVFAVLYEDAYLLIIDKPAGLVVHPAKGHASGTLVNGLLAREGFDIEPESDDDPIAQSRPGIVHRLDKGTSGVMVVAKTEQAREGLKSLFETHDIERSYLALVAGDAQAGTIDTLHGRHPGDRLKFSARVGKGKRAITHVEVLERLAGGVATLVRCRLETGRTHQIRVHLAEVRQTPVLGDPLYGSKPREPWLRKLGDALGHQALHAAVLGFVHPVTGEQLRFETPLPADVQSVLDELRAR